MARDVGANGEIAGIAEVPIAGGRMAGHVSIVFELNESGQPGLLARPRGPLDRHHGGVFEEPRGRRDPVGRAETVRVGKEKYLALRFTDGRVACGIRPARRQTQEASEGLASFAEKRAANWK